MSNYVECFFIKLSDWNKKIYEIFLVYSNLIFLVPTFIALKEKKYLNSFLTFFTGASSAIYHLRHCKAHGGYHNENLLGLYFCDLIFAGLTTINYIRLKKKKLLKIKYLFLASSLLTFYLLALNSYCTKLSGKNYTIFHSLWHLNAGIIFILIEMDCKNLNHNS